MKDRDNTATQSEGNTMTRRQARQTRSLQNARRKHAEQLDRAERAAQTIAHWITDQRRRNRAARLDPEVADVSWGDVGDAGHVAEVLANLVAPDGERNMPDVVGLLAGSYPGDDGDELVGFVAPYGAEHWTEKDT